MNFSKAMKMAVIIFTGAIAAAGLTACGGTKTAADSPSKGGVKIGFIAALTGGAAAYGKSQEEGIHMAVEEINHKELNRYRPFLIDFFYSHMDSFLLGLAVRRRPAGKRRDEADFHAAL